MRVVFSLARMPARLTQVPRHLPLDLSSRAHSPNVQHPPTPAGSGASFAPSAPLRRPSARRRLELWPSGRALAGWPREAPGGAGFCVAQTGRYAFAPPWIGPGFLEVRRSFNEVGKRVPEQPGQAGRAEALRLGRGKYRVPS